MDPDYYRQMAALQSDHWWYEGRRTILASIIKHLSLPKGAQILEAGCGPGANLTMLSCFGELSAFEPDDFASKHAAQISGVNVKTGTLPDQIPFGQNFDLIGAFDVIEHIEDDVAALKALRDQLKDSGYALFTVPAHQWLWSHHDEINHHKRRYSRKTFKAALERAGFHVEKISYYNMWLFPLAVAVRFLKKLGGTRGESDVTMPPAFINKTLLCLFASERFLLGYANLPFGLSLIALCKRQP